MGKWDVRNLSSEAYRILYSALRRFLFRVLAVGPLPRHVAFIMDGNRRFAQNRSLEPGNGHRAGYRAFDTVVQSCCALGISCITVYAFSIDNFKRKPEQVQSIMDLLLEKTQELMREDSLVFNLNAKVRFLGDLSLLNEELRMAAQRLMDATSSHARMLICICVAYTSTNEIVHAVNGSCREKWAGIRYGHLDFEASSEENHEIAVVDLERHMHTTGCPVPDILVRTSGERRLSNFLLWQTASCFLLCLDAPRPDISVGHLLSEILEYQRLQPYLEELKRKL